MKLAEALRTRSDTKKRIEELQTRIAGAATSTEGEDTLDDISDLLDAFDVALQMSENLIEKINRTNASNELRSGMTLTAALAHRDRLMLEIKCLGIMLDSVGRGDYFGMGRTRATELKTIVHLPVTALRKRRDDCSAELRALDMEIQAINWQIDLVE